MQIYGLVANGVSALTGQAHKLHSRKLFHTKEEAEAFSSQFAKLCTGGNPLTALADDEKITVTILEHELVDGE